MRFSFLKNIYLRELPGGPVLGFLGCHCSGPNLGPWWETKIP